MNTGRKYKTYVIAAVVLALAALLIYSFFRKDAVAVEIGRVQRGDMQVTIDGEGKVRSHDRYTVTAPISGKMQRIELHEGDRIPMGYLVTAIDPAPQRPQQPAANEASLNPYAYKVFAPSAGRVTNVFERSERIVQAGMPLVEISKPSKLEIVVDVLSTEATEIPVGAKMLIATQSGNDMDARVRTVEPNAFTKVSSLGVEEQRVNVIADFTEPMSQFGENYRVDVRVIVWEGQNILKVPVSALFKQGENWGVFVDNNGTASMRNIKIGRRNSQEAETLEGLNEDELVILHPPNQLADGDKITAR